MRRLRLIAACLISAALGVGGTIAATRVSSPHNHMGTALYADCAACGAILTGFVTQIVDAPKNETAK